MLLRDAPTCFVELDGVCVFNELLVVDGEDAFVAQPRVETIQGHEDLLTQQVVVPREELLHLNLILCQCLDSEGRGWGVWPLAGESQYPGVNFFLGLSSMLREM